MEIKRDISWRVSLCFLGIVVFSLVIIGKAIYIQQVQGNYWISQAKQQQQKVIEIDADRGTIYSEDGNMLSTSIPFFDIYVDFAADGLREKNGKRFHENLDSLSFNLSALFKDRRPSEYKKELQRGYRKKERYYLLKRNISFQQYQELKQLPLIREGKNKSGFIAEVRSRRLNPYGLLANRTIGLSREFIDSKGKVRNTNVGLEKTYDDALKGESGSRLVRFLAGGVYVPVEGYEVEPEHGKDIVSTIDVNIQDIAENALLKMLDTNECEHGTVIVMEVKTGKIKAIANLGRRNDGTYWENLNYAIRATEPGSTFKLATMLSLLEDGYVTLDQHVNLEKGIWKIGNRRVYDSERHGKTEVTVKQAFELSSNVGMAKLVSKYYSSDPGQYISHLKDLKLDKPTGVDLIGEGAPVIKNPKSRTWSSTTLPWMSFGYEVLVSPLQTLMLYNAVANDGKMMKPYLVNSIQRAGIIVKTIEPEVLSESICSEKTLKSLQECLRGVCSDPEGTGFTLFKGSSCPVAGKTGTALVADGNRGYASHIYQSSFAGYFPANDPEYSCIVVIKNKPFAKKFYGSSVAGPVFKEIANKLFALTVGDSQVETAFHPVADSTASSYTGTADDIKKVINRFEWKYTDSSGKWEYAVISADNEKKILRKEVADKGRMPDTKGMGLKDALFLLETLDLKVLVKGEGKIVSQSIAPGASFNKNQKVILELN